MILFIIYSFAGIYMLLISMRLIHRDFLNQKDPFTRSNVRMSLTLFGIGLLILGIYYGYIYGVVRPSVESQRGSSPMQQESLLP